MKNTSIRRASKSKLCDSKNKQEDSQKKSETLLQSEAQNNGQESAGNETNKITRGYEPCLDISISSVGLGDLSNGKIAREEIQDDSDGGICLSAMRERVHFLQKDSEILQQSLQRQKPKGKDRSEKGDRSLSVWNDSKRSSRKDDNISKSNFQPSEKGRNNIKKSCSQKSRKLEQQQLERRNNNPQRIHHGEMPRPSESDGVRGIRSTTYSSDGKVLGEIPRILHSRLSGQRSSSSHQSQQTRQPNRKPSANEGLEAQEITQPNQKRKQECLDISIYSQEFRSTPISETTTQNQENSICYRWDFPVQALRTQEAEQDYLTQSQHFGEKDLDALLKLNPNSVLSNNLKELSDEDFELFLADSLWQDTITKLKQSRQQSLGRVIKDEGFLLFPTLTSGASTQRSRPAGQTKCEKWFKDNGLIPNGSQLGTKAIALTMGFPSNWFMDLTKQYSKSVTIPSQVKHQAELEPDILQDEQLPQNKQRSPFAESSISIPCLVKQPGHDEVKGVIKQDLGDRFLVDISDELITVSKLFVYPDFSKTVGQIEKNPSKSSNTFFDKYSDNSESDLEISPSKTITPSKKRKKGYGTGYIECKPVKRSGKEYQQYWYHYEEWRKGDRLTKKSRYIPKRLLARVEKLEMEKAPVREVLEVLGKR